MWALKPKRESALQTYWGEAVPSVGDNLGDEALPFKTARDPWKLEGGGREGQRLRAEHNRKI